ncbi:MAG: amidohydrolase [Clostridia bacterium]|nr:amidohydrolase [Clostridia bacterium]
MDLFIRAQELADELTAFRRHLHAHPELGMKETETQRFIMDELQKLGAEIITYPDQNAIVGILKGKPGDRCVALRADMDALPITERNQCDFASMNPGIMHACGHDAHMAIALGAARLLAECKDQWSGCVKLLFEPDEEGHGGGKDMVDCGCMEGVEAVLGLHMTPDYPAGTIFSKAGPVSGSSDDITLVFKGKGCHGAYPERGVDALLMACQAVTALQSLVSRNVSPLDSAVLTLGKIQGGTANNVVCQEVTLRGTLRTLKQETRVFMKEKINLVCHGIAQAMGGVCDVLIRDSYGPVYNDEGLHGLLEAEIQRQNLTLVQRVYPSLGVESFSFFAEKAPGLYYDLGCGVGTALHTDTFTVDEACLPIGAAMQACLALRVLKGDMA